MTNVTTDTRTSTSQKQGKKIHVCTCVVAVQDITTALLDGTYTLGPINRLVGSTQSHGRGRMCCHNLTSLEPTSPCQGHVIHRHLNRTHSPREPSRNHRTHHILH